MRWFSSNTEKERRKIHLLREEQPGKEEMGRVKEEGALADKKKGEEEEENGGRREEGLTERRRRRKGTAGRERCYMYSVLHH